MEERQLQICHPNVRKHGAQLRTPVSKKGQIMVSEVYKSLTRAYIINKSPSSFKNLQVTYLFINGGTRVRAWVEYLKARMMWQQFERKQSPVCGNGLRNVATFHHLQRH